MKFIVRGLLILTVCLMAGATIMAQKQRNHPKAVSIGGVYDGITLGPESGDLGGIRVAIMAAGGKWRAIVQIAEGGGEDPQPHFVDVNVTGNNIAFSVGDRDFSGTVTVAGIKLKDWGLLKRKGCANYFSVGP